MQQNHVIYNIELMQYYKPHILPEMNDATFCFLATRDLVKEHIWREWFDGLERLQFKFSIVVHCPRDKIRSDWLTQFLLPDDRVRKTAWGWLVMAMMSMYDYAVAAHPAEWYTLHSETCAPLVSPARFIETFNKHKHNSFVSCSKAWWNPLSMKRANLHLFPPAMRLVHSQWCIFCHEDLSQMVGLPKTDKRINQVLTTVMRGKIADESYAAILLLIINNLKNVISKPTTLVDWKRNNLSHPHTFDAWNKQDEIIVRDMMQNGSECMFIRKVGPNFPDHILRMFIA